MEFPKDYPMSPPTLHFVSEFYHPNVYKDGKVCISILHPPGHDAMSGELPEERWLPTQTVSTIILSVISILGDPNLSSPANVDASVCENLTFLLMPQVCWRDNRKKFTQIATKLVEKSNARIPSDIKIPHPESNASEREAVLQKRKQEMTRSDLFDDDPDDDLELCSDFPDDDDIVPEEPTESPPSEAKTSKKPHSDKKSSKSKSSHGERKKKTDPSDKRTSREKKETDKKPSNEKKSSTPEKKPSSDKKASTSDKTDTEKKPSIDKRTSREQKETDKKPSKSSSTTDKKPSNDKKASTTDKTEKKPTTDKKANTQKNTDKKPKKCSKTEEKKG